MRVLLKISFTGILLFLSGLTVSSQVKTGEVAGSVVDIHGASLPNAKVMIRAYGRTDGSNVLLGKTDESGGFIFRDLRPGYYVLKVSYQDSESETERMVAVRSMSKSDVTVTFGEGCSLLSDKVGFVSLRDRGEVINSSIKSAIQDLLSADERNNGFILSLENIQKEWLSGDLGAAHIRMLEPDEIKKRADKDGDFQYMSISKFRVVGGCVSVSVDYAWARANGSQIVHMSGAGLSIEYRKRGGKWIGARIGGWIS